MNRSVATAMLLGFVVNPVQRAVDTPSMYMVAVDEGASYVKASVYLVVVGERPGKFDAKTYGGHNTLEEPVLLIDRRTIDS